MNLLRSAFALCFVVIITFLSFGEEARFPHGPTNDHRYIPNRGQWQHEVLYRASFGATTVFAERDALTFTVCEFPDHESHHEHPETERRGHAWRMRFVGASGAVVIGSDASAHYLNYFLGKDPEHWATEVRPFHEITYQALWPGVDLRMHSDAGSFKYDLIASSAAALTAVAFAYDGLDAMRVDAAGRLVLSTSLGEVLELAPVAWYADGNKETVPCSFALEGPTLRFHLGRGVDRSRPLVIDPMLVAATLSGTGDGGGAENFGHCATYDAAGNIYTGARSFGPGYPTTLGAFQGNFGGFRDIAISKLSTDGSTLLWATYVGGTAEEFPHSLVVNAANEVFVMGSTRSEDYPTSGSAFQTNFADAGTGLFDSDIVVTHLNAGGSALLGSTYVGGLGNDGTNPFGTNYGDVFRGEIVLDGAGNCLVASCSSAADFPTTAGSIQTTVNGLQDGVFFSMDPTLSNLLFSTYIGGPDDDMVYGIRSDGAGGYFVCGAAAGGGIPVTAGASQVTPDGQSDAFVLHVNGNASAVLQGTYFGTPADDSAFFVDTDEDGNVYIYGDSQGDVPIQPAGTFGQLGDLFLAKFTPDLATVLISTEIGDGSDFVNYAPIAFLVDVCGNVYLSAHGSLNTIIGAPLTPDAFQTSGGFYLAVIDPTMTSLVFATCYGGPEDHVDGGTSRFDEAGIMYQAVCSDFGFNTTPNAFSNNYPAGFDIGVFKIDLQINVLIASATATPSQGCAPLEVSFTNTSTGSNAWVWNFDDGSPESSVFEPVHVFDAPGVYDVRMIASGPSTCTVADTVFIQITVSSPDPIAASFNATPSTDCAIPQVTVTNTSSPNASEFIWLMGDGTQLTGATVTHTYAASGTYTIQLIASDPAGCTIADTAFMDVTIDAGQNIVALIDQQQTVGCESVTIAASAVDPWPSAIYTWILEDGSQVDGTTLAHTIDGAGTFIISLIASDPNACNLADTSSFTIEVEPLPPISASFTLTEQSECGSVTVTTQNTSSGGPASFLWEMSDGSSYTDPVVTHTFAGTGSYTITMTMTDVAGCQPPSIASATVVVPEPPTVVADLIAQQMGPCSELVVGFNDTSQGTDLIISLDLGDGTVLNSVPPNYTYPGPGSYVIEFTVTDPLCGSQDEQTVEVLLIDTVLVSIDGPQLLCANDELVLHANTSAGTLLWSTGASTADITVTQSGVYSVTASTGNCVGAAITEIKDAPAAPRPNAVDSCPGVMLALRIPVEAALTYQWAIGGNTQEQVVEAEDGAYVYSGIDANGCAFSDSIVVRTFDPETYVYIPNAFTPNGDGVNDLFSPSVLGERVSELLIFDRWGEQLYASAGSVAAWDGSYNGQQAVNDIYVYRIRYTGVCYATDLVRIGHVTVVR